MNIRKMEKFHSSGILPPITLYGKIASMAKIVTNPEILLGKPTIAGTRIAVSLILNLLAHGLTIEQIIEDYPQLTPEDIKAAVKYAEKIVEKVHPANRAIAHEIFNRRKHR